MARLIGQTRHRSATWLLLALVVLVALALVLGNVLSRTLA